MALKTQDIPMELSTWWKSFHVVSYWHNYSRVFADWVTMTLAQFVPPGTYEKEFAEAMSPFDRKEKDAFNEMFFEFFRVFNQMIEVKGKPYYDALGHMYETLASQGKKASLGQFFTPEPLVEILVGQTLFGMEELQGKRILDPACGSGRMLYVAHVHAPGSFLYGIDIDQLCAKMTAINMMMHGCVGEVVCGDALFLENNWRFAFAINPLLICHGVPSILPIGKDESFVWNQNESWASPVAESEEEPLKQKKPEEKKQTQQGQLTIF